MSTATQSASRPLGVLILGRKRPGFDQEWNQIMCRRALAALAGLGYTAIGAEVPVVDDITITAALDRLQQTGCRPWSCSSPPWATASSPSPSPSAGPIP